MNTVNLNSYMNPGNRETVRSLIHELHNQLQSATMEVELARLGATQQIDAAKLLGLLDSFAQSLRALQSCILPSAESARETPRTMVTSVLTDTQQKLSERNIDLQLLGSEPMPMADFKKDDAHSALETEPEFPLIMTAKK